METKDYRGMIVWQMRRDLEECASTRLNLREQIDGCVRSIENLDRREEEIRRLLVDEMGESLKAPESDSSVATISIGGHEFMWSQ